VAANMSRGFFVELIPSIGALQPSVVFYPIALERKKEMTWPHARCSALVLGSNRS
jgi:hypothetical protein